MNYDQLSWTIIISTHSPANQPLPVAVVIQPITLTVEPLVVPCSTALSTATEWPSNSVAHAAFFSCKAAVAVGSQVFCDGSNGSLMVHGSWMVHASWLVAGMKSQ